MLTVIIGHTSRAEQIATLQRQTGAYVFLDDGTLGAIGNHYRAIVTAAHLDESLLVIEDDALPVENFTHLARAWIDRHPYRLISFYLGTDARLIQDEIRDRLAMADHDQRDYIEINALAHAVAYYIPSPYDLLPYLTTDINPDDAIGAAWHQLTGRPVLYTVPSLVDHADGPSVDKPAHLLDYPLPARHAWRLP